ncbi:hypothetical protein DL771_004994 [Monosporascus sp. 5C6A]|nr:hypothetical protein DL771_004994 [Monosporascus sp. 5C6A]
MAREGTRSATGHSSVEPRVFQTVDTEPAIKRTVKPKKAKASTSPTATSASGTKAAKPVGVTKKTAAPKKPGVGAKARAVVKKGETKVKGGGPKTKKAAKPKTTATTEEAI